MSLDFAFVAAAFVAIFAVINPISKIIFFPILTMEFTKKEKRMVISTAVLYSLAILLSFGLIGQYLFGALGVGMVALRITAAVMIIKIGFDMLQGQIPKTKFSQAEGDEALEKKAVGVFPLAIPFTAGPGAIITVMMYISMAPTYIDGLMVMISVVIVLFITLAILFGADKMADKMGKIGVLASMRLMGMVLLAIGIQMIIESMIEIIHTL